MKFASSAAVLSLAGLVAASSLNIPRQNCPQASRFGVLSVSPTDTPLNPGDNFNVNVDFTCGINNFGIVPKFLDYTIVVPAPNNNGHEQPIVLARRTLAAGATADTFTAQVPHGFYFKDAPYSLLLTNNYPIKGTDGSEVIVQGGVYAGLNLNTTNGL